MSRIPAQVVVVGALFVAASPCILGGVAAGSPIAATAHSLPLMAASIPFSDPLVDTSTVAGVSSAQAIEIATISAPIPDQLSAESRVSAAFPMSAISAASAMPSARATDLGGLTNGRITASEFGSATGLKAVGVKAAALSKAGSKAMTIMNGGTVAVKVGGVSPVAKAAVAKAVVAKAVPAKAAVVTAVHPAGPSATPRSIAQGMAGSRGWSGEQWVCLDELWRHESQYETWARNSRSGAFGIPQALPASKMASAGADWRTSASTQVKWGLGYIAARYDTPCGAWWHEERYGSY